MQRYLIMCIYKAAVCEISHINLKESVIIFQKCNFHHRLLNTIHILSCGGNFHYFQKIKDEKIKGQLSLMYVVHF